MSIALSPVESSRCLRCETLPPKLTGPGTLHLRFPLAHSRAKILNYLRDAHLQYFDKEDTLSIQAPEQDLTPLLAPLMNVLSSTEQADVRVLFEASGRPLQLSDYFEIESLDSFLARAQSGWLVDMIDQDRLTSWFQPIVHCADPKRVFAYECLLRGREGDQMVPPKRILDVARGSGLLFQLDRAARLSAIRQAADFGVEATLFINFTPTSIYDPVNCLRTTVQEVDRRGLRRDQVTFEVIESESVRDTQQLKDILDFYRSSGFGVALDDVGSGYSSLNLLGLLRPDYIKLDRELTTNVHADPYKATIARKLLETAQELGLKTIVEGVELQEEYAWARDHGADYAQGYFFARPGSPPPLL